MSIAPCKNCENRYVGCHSSCESYLKWAKKHAQDLEVIRKGKREHSLYADYNVAVKIREGKQQSKHRYSSNAD